MKTRNTTYATQTTITTKQQFKGKNENQYWERSWCGWRRKNVLFLLLLLLDKRISHCLCLVDIDEEGVILGMAIHNQDW